MPHTELRETNSHFFFASQIYAWCNCNYRAGRPLCRKVLKIMFWEVPPADWLIL